MVIQSPADDMDSSIRATTRARRGLQPSAFGDSIAIAAEHCWGQIVFLQQPIELGTVAVGNPGRIGDTAIGQLEKLNQIVALETLFRVGIA